MKLPKRFAPLLVAQMAVLCTSCASVMHGTRQSIGISTNPTNAEVWLDSRFVGRSPMIIEMKRKDNHFVQIRLDGYQPYDLTFTREISGWVAGNIVCGGLIGLAIDAVTGGIYQLTPDQVQVEMRKGSDVSCVKESDTSFIAIVLEVDPSWEKIDNLVAYN